LRNFYDIMARFYDCFVWGAEKRYGHEKSAIFSAAEGKTLLVGVGTGIDLKHMPPGLEITAIDLSSSMLKYASKRAQKYDGKIELLQCNIEKTDFPDNCFDSVVTSCVFCSVSNPIQGLKEIHRILKPGGKLIMLEHVLSRNILLKPMLYMMNVMIPFGPEFTRNTIQNVKTAGFKVSSERNLILDIVKAVEATP